MFHESRNLPSSPITKILLLDYFTHTQKTLRSQVEAMRVCCYLVHGLGLEVIAYIPAEQDPLSTINLKSNEEDRFCSPFMLARTESQIDPQLGVIFLPQF